MKINISILMAIVALTLASCIKNEIVYNTDDLDYRPVEIAGPLAKVHIPLLGTMEKHFDFDGSFIVNKNGVICLEYSHSKTIEWSDEIGIDNSFDWDYPIGSIASVIVNSKFKKSLSHSIRLIINEAKNKDDTYVRKAEFSAGNLLLSLKVPVICDVELSVPELTLSTGESFTKSLKNLTPGTIHEISISNLNGYTLTPNPSTHMLKVDCDFFVTTDATVGDIEVSFKLENTRLRYLSGYFGTVEKSIKNQKDFDFFEKLNFSGTIGFGAGIEVFTKITNGTGIPFKIEGNNDDTKCFSLDNIKGDFDLETSEIDVPAANEDSYHVVDPKTTPQILFAKFGNINFIDYPSKIMYDIKGTANPNPGVVENFIVKNDQVLSKADFTFVVPLNINLKDFNRDDTVKFDYKDLLKEDEKFHDSIEDFVINLVVDNNLPFNITLSAKAINKNGKDVGEVIVNKEEIKANEKKKTIKVDKLTRNQLNEFWNKDVKNIVLHTESETTGDQYLPVKKDDYLDVSVSVRFKSNIPLKLFE